MPPTPPAATVERVMRTLAKAIDGLEQPAVERIRNEAPEDAFRVLVGTLLSAQTRDAVTDVAAKRLFRRAKTPRALAALDVAEIQKLIYPVSFYRIKAANVKAACGQIISRFGGRVPGRMEELLELPGVGRKTANLVLILAHRSADHICVDTHVHRIANRLGWVRTRTPEQTEQALYRATARRWWPHINLYLVTWGQHVCRPVYPLCGSCDIRDSCPRVGVTKVGKGRYIIPPSSEQEPSR
jgi:endonuclease-3